MSQLILKIKKPAPGSIEIIKYLEANKWILSQTWTSEQGLWVRYYYRDSEASQIAIPHEDFVDYVSTVSQVINEIADLEKKTSYEIYEEILSFKSANKGGCSNE